ncbi:MAG: hypothetical protein K2N94_10075 [Lachnospiraceae bacterium]|nr:hypothetical protein [Lachnospiraceae bacterium]
MNQKAQVGTQMDMLEKCLVCKKELLKKIYEATREQEAILDTEPFSDEAFESTLQTKEELIALLAQYDEGFENTFGRVRDEVLADRESYRTRIESMQKLITELTEQGVRIQALEQKNRLKLEVYLNSRKQEIKAFNVSSRTVSNYYKSMTGAGKGEAYFMDKKR